MYHNLGRHRSATMWALLWLILFVALSVLVETEKAAPFDSVLRDGLHQFATPGLTMAFAAITHLGSVLVVSAITVLSIAAFWLTGLHAAARLAGWTMAGSALLDNSLKYLFQRARPEPFFGLDVPASFSFPSGHALFSTCLFGALAFAFADPTRSSPIRLAIWACAAGLVAAIGLSRIYLGVHYPSDVAGGCLVGFFCLACVRAVLPTDRAPKVPR